ncbi:MAG: phosphoribosylformylglycinamidine synthase I [Cyclobacteriaceae bacterium]|nr:phosphoribosylformylglycinamidine synthase I [Cyclobacteriaceae bacterium]MCH8515530.1 phosphoribosylformylglycinamidine synthase I [Cyclobacteriaceae bacterium]
MKVGVVIFPGSNCDEDMVHVMSNVMGFDVERLWHKSADLKGVDLVVLPGGFSYGDYLRSGAISGLSPIMDQVREHAKKGGLVLGICNGFQVLTESRLLPGALLHNDNQRFICKNTFLKPASTTYSISSALDADEVLRIPVAHAEGRYFIDAKGLEDLQANDQILFRYSDENGDVNADTNLNGSIDNIAGICNKAGNVIGMMPHPERAAEQVLGNTDGLKILQAMLSSVTVK